MLLRCIKGIIKGVLKVFNGVFVFSFRCIRTVKDCATQCGENRFIMKQARIAW